MFFRKFPLALRFAGWFFAATLAGGCAYKIEIEQGDEFLPERLDGLETGMTRAQVVALLGDPNLPRMFRPDIWLYGYQLRKSGFADDSSLLVVELHFDENGRVNDILLRGDEITEE